MSRPLVTVYNSQLSLPKPEKPEGSKIKVVSMQGKRGLAPKGQLPLPEVFNAPIRTDIVNRMHAQVKKNLQQPYAVSRWAGGNTAAESWGTGRAVSRIPRVPGSGTHRAGQGAFGNMCRGGRMFAPTKVWRKWHHIIKTNERRYATASAISASGVTALVLARGHRVNWVQEVPFVVSNDIQSYHKTKEAFEFLKRSMVIEDVRKVKQTKALRAGKGKSRGRKYKMRLGPLIVYNEDQGIVKAFRNIPGVDLCSVNKLNILQLAPGGNVGRFIIWTEAAFDALNNKFGSYTLAPSILKRRNGTNYRLPRCEMQNTDLTKIIDSDNVQANLRPWKLSKRVPRRRNPLKNIHVMQRLNPLAYAIERKKSN